MSGLVSKLLGVEFDAIWQRHKRLLIQKMVAYAVAILAVLAGAVLSVAVEYGQYRFLIGNAEADDVICNSLGTFIGALSLPIKEYLNRHRE